jgi:hypothetical protein
MGYESASQLTVLIGERNFCPSRLDQLDSGILLPALADLLGHNPSELRNLTIYRWSHRLLQTCKSNPSATDWDLKTAMRFFRLYGSAVCSRCLAEDPSYEHLKWSFRPQSICTIHRCWLLMQCPNCSKMPKKSRWGVYSCNCGFDLRQSTTMHASNRLVALSNTIDKWFDGELPIPDLPPVVSWAWVERVALALAQTVPWIKRSGGRWNIPSQVTAEMIAWLAVADLMADWPPRVSRFLDAFCTSDTGAKFAP